MRLVLLCACLLPVFCFATGKPRFALKHPEVLDSMGVVHKYFKGTGWDVDAAGNLYVYRGDQVIGFYNNPRWVSLGQAGIEKFSKKKVF